MEPLLARLREIDRAVKQGKLEEATVANLG
jgi:hypothetical protein